MHCYYYAYSRKLVEFYFELLFRRGDLLISDGGGGGFGLAAALFLFLFFFSFFFFSFILFFTKKIDTNGTPVVRITSVPG